ncbi:class I SAM-dependent methyltransferase [Streptomyces jeddahensis]|uniref:Class I SAM-dependent methyltransferase n=1 Tax=Streptomyces jeddahensis TaxID=1716141 RepID=A0A177HHM1_9ACTN|nr:class I SAM-dependent methyltransferase [Streptomyces jeddahensis]OAH10089.1 hypothetical protein STSP_65960 [Streptomyces jeddahensis]
MTTRTAPGRARSLSEVPGWFRAIDQDLFRVLLETTGRTPGDLLEMGCYLGKSAILLGEHLREGETFTVCDLFGVESHGLYSRRDTLAFYRETLTREAFEANYLNFHEDLPVIVHARTTALASRIAPGSCRFVHIDASRTYEDVSGDIDIARSVLRKDGVVAIDDYRTEHVPGVAAAVWEAVFTKGLRPVCLSAAKLYATWGEPEPFQQAVRAWATDRVDRVVVDEKIDGDPVLRVLNALPGPSGARRLALELLPPVVSRALVRPKTGR